MGRNKIKIQYLKDDRIRNITFNKRKNGLLKKACELAVLCEIRIVLAFTDLHGNVYNFMAPDGSAPEAIKRSHSDHNVYNMIPDDYPHFCKRKEFIEKSESLQSIEPDILEKRRNQNICLHQVTGSQDCKNKKRRLNLKIQIPDADNRDQVNNDFGIKSLHSKMFENIVMDHQDNSQLCKKKEDVLDHLNHLSPASFQPPPPQSQKFLQHMQTSFGTPQNNPPRVFFLVDINNQFQQGPSYVPQPNCYQNLGYSNLPSVQSNISYFMNQGNLQSPALNFQFENDPSFLHQQKQASEEPQSIQARKKEKSNIFNRMEAEQNKRPTDL